MAGSQQGMRDRRSRLVNQPFRVFDKLPSAFQTQICHWGQLRWDQGFEVSYTFSIFCSLYVSFFSGKQFSWKTLALYFLVKMERAKFLHTSCRPMLPPSHSFCLTNICPAGMQEAGFEDDVVQPSLEKRGIGSQCLNQNSWLAFFRR